MPVLLLLLTALLGASLVGIDSASASRTPPNQSIALPIQYDGNWVEIRYASSEDAQQCAEEVCEQ